MIVNEIIERVNSAKAETKYKTPLVGFSDANNPYFRKLKTIISEEHYLPSDLLPNAKTVVTFFIPFDEEIVFKNLKCDTTAREWAYGKKDAQGLIGEIIEDMKVKLGEINIGCSGNPNKESYNQEKFMHRWSLSIWLIYVDLVFLVLINL